MEEPFDDSFDDLLAEINDPSPAKNKRLDTDNQNQAGTSSTTQKSVQIKSHCVLVNQKQRGNPLLKSITSVPWEFDDIIPDYEMGKTICALFLSLRYYNLNPDYLNNRLKELGRKYELRVLLVQVDLKDPQVPLKNITRICLLADLTLMLAWSSEEAAKIIENYKIYENKPPDRIMEKIDNDPHQKIVNALSSIKPVNKTDAMTLLRNFGTLKNIIKAPEEKLAACPGFGARKASRLFKVLHEPFMKSHNTLSNQSAQNNSFDQPIDINEIESIESKLTS